MFVRSIRSLFVLASIGVALLLGAQPVFADTELGHTGTVGVHSLTDTASSPGAKCKYRYLSAYDYGRLKRIVVQPPNMRAVAGKSAQKVGWQFTIQRREMGLGGSSPWEPRYTSPEMTAITSASHNATFSSASVGVTTPFGPDTEDAGAIYRVNVKMIWHRPDGSVQGTARHRVNYYRSVLDIGGSGLQNNVCSDYWSPNW
jgi:hypothetical protein